MWINHTWLVEEKEKKEMEEDGIEEASVSLLGSSGSGGGGGRSGGGGGGESWRWVDGSEMDSEPPPWAVFGDEAVREGYGSVRRRLVKRPKRVDSFDVEAMEIADMHGHHKKVKEKSNRLKSHGLIHCVCVFIQDYVFRFALMEMLFLGAFGILGFLL